MKITPLKSIGPAVLLLFFFARGIPGQDAGVANEFDPGISVAVDLTRRVRLDFYAGREKSEELEGGKWKINPSISFRVKPLFKRFLDALDTDKQHVLVLGIGYEYSRATESRVTKREHLIMLDATVRWAFKQNVLMSNRNRLEVKWVNGESHFRIRERLMFERPLKLPPLKLIKRDITPYGFAEATWDQQFRKWNVFKFGVGTQIPIIRRSSLDISYQREHCVTCPDPQTNILSATLNIYLIRKK